MTDDDNKPDSDEHPRRTLIVLLGCVALTALLYVVPYGDRIGYPLVLMSTVAHELGHGLTALLLGGDFQRLVIRIDGSGVAYWQASVGGIGVATVAAGGLVGPAVVAGLCFRLGRRPRSAHWLLVVFAALLVAILAFVPTVPPAAEKGAWFGRVFLGGLVACIVAVLWLKKPAVSQFVLLFVGVQLALSVFSRSDYLFTRSANSVGRRLPSDVQLMADALWLPYWFWGLLCGSVSVAILVFGLRPLLRRAKADAAAKPATTAVR